MRAIGLDVHRDFCEVAIAEAGAVRSAGRIATRPAVLELFAASLGADDRVVLEVCGNAWEIARIIEPHVARVVVVSPSDTGIRHARAKTDRLDARTLAKLLAAGSLDSVWMPDERTRVMRRRLARRDQLVTARTRAKNEIHAILIRRLKGRPDVSDLFGKRGRTWLAELELDPKVRQSGGAPAGYGHISKQGAAPVRRALVEASWSAVRQPGPLRAFYQRIRARRGHQVAITAAARKLACLFWVLLWRQQDYAFGLPSLTAKKIRRLEITAGAPRWQDRRGVWIAHRLLRDAELDLARQAEHAYAQTVRDRQAAGAIKAGASATPGRASQQPSKGKAARQTTSP